MDLLNPLFFGGRGENEKLNVILICVCILIAKNFVKAKLNWLVDCLRFGLKEGKKRKIVILSTGTMNGLELPVENFNMFGTIYYDSQSFIQSDLKEMLQFSCSFPVKLCSLLNVVRLWITIWRCCLLNCLLGIKQELHLLPVTPKLLPREENSRRK